MITLLNTVQDVIEKIIGSVLFADPAGPARALRYSIGELPDKRAETEQGEDFPFCLVSPGKFSFSREGKTQKVDIAFGLYTAGDKDAGLAMVDGVMTLMATAPREIFTPYKLMGDLTGAIETGRHPYYILTFSGEFRKAR